MVWEQLSINKPHLVYIILGGFTSIFMLCSLVIKEKLYIGEATVATVVGLIFGPHAANLVDPATWGNTDQITLEFSRIVLVVQCFAVGVELPKAYMERHWLSVVLLLIPVMTYGWLITSLFMWWMIEPLNWLESLTCAACVTATDPVLASSVVGKGKFAKRVPKHIRDLLSAESGCNDGMAFPFIYLALYLIHYELDASKVTFHWFCNTILYECIWGAVYGVLVGYIARQAIRFADRKGYIDRESFLVFYFVLALFCAGSGSLLGMDDLLIGFAAGVGFSNDGWFQEKTEESHVSNVIDLLLNLTYFVYLGTIIPWDQYNNGVNGLEAWRLVVIAIMVIFFRRIPIMLMLKPFIPDIKTWREALFCGHFGPIGVGAIFVAILARAELETSSTTPLANPPGPGEAEYVLIYVIWPLTTFLVITSIVVHGSSVAVFTLGKRINTLTLTLSYTTGNDQSSNWMTRLPRISSMGSKGKSFNSEFSEDEKGDLTEGGIPKLHLRRQKEDEYDEPKPGPRIRSRSKKRSKKKYGGPIEESAIFPTRNHSEPALTHQESGSDTLNEKSAQASPERDGSTHSEGERERAEERRGSSPDKAKNKRTEQDDSDVEVEAYEEGHEIVIEDEEGNVLETVPTHGRGEDEKRQIVEAAKDKLRADKTGNFTKHKHRSHPRNEGEEIEEEVEQAAGHPEKSFKDTFKHWKGFGRKENANEPKERERKRGPAHAYQFGNTVIVEDEDGEVIKTYTLPRGEGEGTNSKVREGMQRVGTRLGLNRKESRAQSSGPVSAQKVAELEHESTENKEVAEREDRPMKNEDKTKTKDQPRKSEDDGLRMVISHTDQYGLTGLRKPRAGERPDMITMGGGRRLSTKDFIMQMQQLDKSTRQNVMDQAGVGKDIKEEVHKGAVPRRDSERGERVRPNRSGTMPTQRMDESTITEEEEPQDYFSKKASRGRAQSESSEPQRPKPTRTGTSDSKASIASSKRESVDEEQEIPSHNVRKSITKHSKKSGVMSAAELRRQQYVTNAQSSRINEDQEESDPEEETAAEKKRRLAALGYGGDESDSSSDEDDGPRVPRQAVQEPSQEEAAPPQREREQPAEAPRMRVQWGGETRGPVRGQDDEEAQLGDAAGGSGRTNMKRRLTKFLAN